MSHIQEPYSFQSPVELASYFLRPFNHLDLKSNKNVCTTFHCGRVRSWIWSTLSKSPGWGEDPWQLFHKLTCWESLMCCVRPDALAMLRTQKFFCKSTCMGIPVSLRAEGRISGRHCCWSSYQHRHTNLLKESMNLFSYMSSFSFYDIYLFQYFHSNCSYEITQT